MARRIERIILWVLIIEALLKIVGIHFPGQSQLLIMTFSTAAYFYFLGGFILFNPNGNFNFKGNNDILASVLLGFVQGLATTSLLFTLFFWPGSTQIWLVTLGISIVLLVYLLWRLQSKSMERMAHRRFLLLRATIVLILSLAFYVIPPSLVLRVVHRDYEEEYLDKFGKSLDHPKNEAYRKEWKEYKMKVDSIDKANKNP